MTTTSTYKGQVRKVKATCRHCGKRYWKQSWQRAAHCTKQKGIVRRTGTYQDAE